MELRRIPEEFQTKARTVLTDAKGKLEKVEEKYPQLVEWQEKVEKVLDSEWLLEKSGINDYMTKITSESGELRERTSVWFEENYANVLDRIGVATKDEVEVLRKKLSTLQRKINKMKKELQV